MTKCRKGCIESPPKEGTDFWLSLNIENEKKPSGKYQTMFVESPLEEGIGNTFAIAGTITCQSFDPVTGDFRNIKIQNMGIRRLSGIGFKIDEVSTKISNEDGRNVRVIDITLREAKLGSSDYDEHLKEVHLSIPKLNKKEPFETRVYFAGINRWRPRICELYVGSSN
ncbi:MAG: hypothetical protein Mars2KO_15120 [Maribacter sp.]